MGVFRKFVTGFAPRREILDPSLSQHLTFRCSFILFLNFVFVLMDGNMTQLQELEANYIRKTCFESHEKLTAAGRSLMCQTLKRKQTVGYELFQRGSGNSRVEGGRAARGRSTV